MKVLSFFNYKGGVGKTTSSVTIANLLAKLYKQRVLVIDFDAQCNATNDFSAIDMKHLRDCAFRGEFEFEEDSSFEVLTDENYDIRKAIRTTRYENLDIIPSVPILDEACVILMNEAGKGKAVQRNLANKIKVLEEHYDYVIIDCAPHKDLITTNALIGSDYLYVPILPDPNSSIGLAMAKMLMETTKNNFNPNLEFGGAFFASFHNHNADKEEFEAISQYLGDKLIDVKIPESTNVRKMHQQQKQLDEINKSHNVTLRYIELAEYIFKQTQGENV